MKIVQRYCIRRLFDGSRLCNAGIVSNSRPTIASVKATRHGHGPTGDEMKTDISEAIMDRFKQILRPYNAMLLVLFAGFLFPVSAQSQELESLTAMEKGQGMIASTVDKQKITSALVFLRQNGTALIAIYADVQLQAEGTWSTSASSPEVIILKITGGVLKGEMTGSGKLLLTSDRDSFKELTMNVTIADGQEVRVTFKADEPSA